MAKRNSDEVTLEVYYVVIMLRKTEITQGKYRENAGNFIFQVGTMIKGLLLVPYIW